MVFYVNEVRYPPVCTHSTSMPLEIAKKSGALDPLDNLTSDWNPELAVCWAYRAWKLKDRGTWLVNKHLDKSKSASDTKYQSKSGQPNEETIRLWSCAFSCYSRALQLARLAKWARQTCGTLNPSAGDCHSDTLKSPWFSKPLHIRKVDPSASDEKHSDDKECPRHSANCVDLDYPQNFEFEGAFSVSISSLERLEYSLLLNLALCQLKVGSMELAAENCSHALLFDPGWMKFAKQREEMGDSGSALNSAERDKWEFTNLDIAKALYRRAQAYSSIANWDDAESDLKMVILLQKYPNKDGLPSGGGSLAASEALLKHVRTNTSRDSAALAERLRRHRSEL